MGHKGTAMETGADHQTANHQTDVAIIGAGPAGLAAAERLAPCAVTITIVDEQAAAGGQFLRQPPPEIRVLNWLPGRLYDKGKSLLNLTQALPGANWRFGTTVLGLFENDDPKTSGRYPWRLWLSDRNRSWFLNARKVLIAPGCYDRPVAFPGWMLPGVMATGGLQAMLKSQQVIPGDNILFAGTHPLQLIVADQIVKAGGKVGAICFAQNLRTLFSAPASPAALWASRPKYSEALACMVRLKKAGVSLHFGRTIVSALGKDRVEGMVVAPLGAGGKPNLAAQESIAGDIIGICFGFLVSSELARQAGASVTWSEAKGGWIVRHDRWMHSDRPGLSVAGEITGLAGADVAMEEGRLAALGLLRDLELLDDQQCDRMASTIRRELEKHKLFAKHLRRASRPPKGLLDSLIADDTVLCRCEAVTAGELKSLLAENPTLMTANAVKLLGRAGMGPCQGRYCGHNVQNLIARERNASPESVGGFTPQAPLKPVSINTVVQTAESPSHQ